MKNTPRSFAPRLSLLLVLAAAPWCSAQTTIWTGAIDNNWNIAGNWTLNAIPDSSTGVLIDNGGTAEINAGQSAESAYTYLGANTGGTSGHVTVTGAGATWHDFSAIVVGNEGTGSLTISAGGTVTSGEFVGGGAPGGTGVITVTGSGSSLVVDGGGLYLGYGGGSASGVLTIADNANVTNNGSLMRLGSFDNSSGAGTLNIGGAVGETAVAAGHYTGPAIDGAIGADALVNFNHTDSGYTFATALVGSLRVEHNGPGTTILTGANTYDGGTTIIDGTLVGAHDTAFGTGNVTLADGNVALYLDGGQVMNLANNIAVSAGTGSATIGSVGSGGGTFVTYNGDLALDRATTLYDSTSAGNRTTFTGVISGNVGTLTIAGDSGSRVTLAGENTFTGDVVVNGGTILQLSTDGNQVLPLAANVTLTSSAKLWIVNDTTIGSLTGGEASVVQVAAGGVPASALTVGANDASTTFEGGMHNGTSGSGSLSLVKSGTGTLTLSGSSTYDGGTLINGGTLVAGAGYTGILGVSSSLGTGTVTVNSGGTLSGDDFIIGLTTVNSGGHLAPDGVLRFDNGLTLNNGANLDFELGTSSPYLIDVNGGTLTGSGEPGGITLNLFDDGDFAPNFYYTLIDFGDATGVNSFDLTDFAVGSRIAGYNFAVSFDGSLLQVRGTSAIPEPSTYAMLAGLGALGFVMLRRRRSAA